MKKQNGMCPFSSNLDYLAAFLDLLACLGRKRLMQRRLESQELGHGAESEHTESSARAAPVSQSSFRRLCRDLAAKEEVLSARIAKTLAQGAVELPLEVLARDNGLCEFEKRVLALVLGPSLDHSFRRLMGDLCNSMSTDMRAVLDILCDSVGEKIRVRKHFIHTGRLLGNRLLNVCSSRDMDTEDGFMGMDLGLPRRISSYILGEYDVDDAVTTYSHVIDPEIDIDQVVLPPAKKREVLELASNRDVYLACRRAWGFDRLVSYGKGTIMLFSGPSGAGKTMLAHALARATGHRLMLVDIHSVGEYGRHELSNNLQRIFQEARLQHAILFFDEADEMFSDRYCNPVMPTLLREFEKLDGIAILATNRKQILDEALERRVIYKLDFETPTPDLRETIWRKHLPPEAPVAEDVNVTALAEEFEFTGGFIKNAVLVAMQRAAQRPQAARRITQADLRAGALLQRQNRLGSLTDKVVPKVGLDDVVLHQDTRRQVEAIVAAARQRLTVFSAWGFGRRMSSGRALSALFTGASGTGKTMTAEAIAYELGQCLYPVKLSSVISKYVGETEKNMAQVFKGAQEAQAIIFFDEADALFAKRLDGEDSHALYHNQQIDALLTEIEKYDGLVILATNRPEAFDEAFERRLCYRVQFRAPDAERRREIWRSLLPSETPVGKDVDFDALAREFAFTGGTIKTVALRAAFAAATNGRVITQAILRRCAEEEKPLNGRGPLGFSRGRG